MTKINYLSWAVRRALTKSSTCPYCGSADRALIERKFIVTALVECADCGLRYRTPVDDPSVSIDYYQDSYRQGFTTELPDASQLEELKRTRFRDTEKDFGSYIAVLEMVGLERGSTVLDFGASWGYGSWQLQQHGYVVTSYEIGQRRAAYAREKLACNVCTSKETIIGKFDCIFSSHVLEHMSDPGEFWRVSKERVRPGGTVVCIVPNGDPASLRALGASRYHHLWGKVHPLLLSARVLHRMASDHGFDSATYSSPYPLDLIKSYSSEGDVSGDELLVVARHRTS